MKKVLALVLGLVMVFAVASMASAVTLSVSGYMTLHGDLQQGDSFLEGWEWGWDYGESSPIDNFILFTVGEKLGDVSIEGNWMTYDSWYLMFSHASLMYQINDLVNVGLTITGYCSDADEGDESDVAVYEPTLVVSDSHHLECEEVWLTGSLNFDDGSLTVYMELGDGYTGTYGLGGSYVFGGFSVGGGYYDDYGTPNYDLYVKYALNEEFSFMGDVVSDDGSNYVGLQAAYDNGTIAGKATLAYNTDNSELADWAVEGSYKLTDLISVEAKYLMDGGDGLVLRENLCYDNGYDVDQFMVGALFTFDPRATFELRYWMNDNDGLEMVATYTF